MQNVLQIINTPSLEPTPEIGNEWENISTPR